jgi:hypothetical protein
MCALLLWRNVFSEGIAGKLQSFDITLSKQGSPQQLHCSKCAEM